jgi:hypothetical protein
LALSSAPKYPPPLGLPQGSVRAILALVLCGSLWYEVVKDLALSPILLESSLLVVAFYFGVRSTAPPSQPVIPTAVPVTHPLHLPRGAVRGFLLFGFFAVIAYLWLKGRPLTQEFVLILQVLASYLIGFGIAYAVERRRRLGRKPNLVVAVFRNLNAVWVIGLTVYMCGVLVVGWTQFYPQLTGNSLAWIVAYYFGSRVSP